MREPVVDSGPNHAPCRRRRRHASARLAVRYQIQHVAEHNDLTAIVLADELGRVLEQAGDPELSLVLAASALWAEFADSASVDDFTLATLCWRWPDLSAAAITEMDVPNVHGAQVIAAEVPGVPIHVVKSAAGGIGRICAGAPELTAWFGCSTSAMRPRALRRDHNRTQATLRWFVSVL